MPRTDLRLARALSQGPSGTNLRHHLRFSLALLQGLGEILFLGVGPASPEPERKASHSGPLGNKTPPCPTRDASTEDSPHASAFHFAWFSTVISTPPNRDEESKPCLHGNGSICHDPSHASTAMATVPPNPLSTTTLPPRDGTNITAHSVYGCGTV